MASDGGNRSGGIGFFGALGILFIGLRLAGFIDWPWWLVLSPLWGSAVLWLAFVVVVACDTVRQGLNDQRRWRK